MWGSSLFCSAGWSSSLFHSTPIHYMFRLIKMMWGSSLIPFYSFPFNVSSNKNDVRVPFCSFPFHVSSIRNDVGFQSVPFYSFPFHVSSNKWCWVPVCSILLLSIPCFFLKYDVEYQSVLFYSFPFHVSSNIWCGVLVCSIQLLSFPCFF